MRFLTALFALVLLAAPLSAETTMGDDGLHKTEWMHDTFKDLREDLSEANAEGKRLALVIEQRGCIYCTKMHEEVWPDPEINTMLNEDFFFVQINMFGDVEVTDFDGEVLTEKEMVMKWGVMFTPTVLFLPEEVPEGVTAPRAAVGLVPGALSRGMTLDMLTWVHDHIYENGENFQKYHARMLEQR
jgi:thioredoxin-related protein